MTSVIAKLMSREFILALGSMLIGGVLLWKDQTSEIGIMLVLGAQGGYAVGRVSEKLVRAKGEATIEVASIEASKLDASPRKETN